MDCPCAHNSPSPLGSGQVCTVMHKFARQRFCWRLLYPVAVVRSLYRTGPESPCFQAVDEWPRPLTHSLPTSDTACGLRLSPWDIMA